MKSFDMKKFPIASIIAGLILAVPACFSIYNHPHYDSRTMIIPMMIAAVALSVYLAVRLVDKFRHKASTWNFIIEFILSFIVGNLVVKSYVINILPFAYVSSIISSLIMYIGWSVIGCAIIYLITHILSKVSWQGKSFERQGFKQYLLFCLPSFIILGIMYAIYFPGTGTIDTTWLWSLIHENKFSDTHPLMLMVYYKFLTMLWDSYGVISLFQFLITVFTIGYAVNYFASKGLNKKWCYIAATLMPLYPVVAMYTVTLWKDIPYSMFLLIFMVMTIKVFEDAYLNKPINMVKYTLVGLTVMFFRHNGFVAVIGTGGLVFLYGLFRKNYKLVFQTLIIGVCLVGLFVGIKNVTKTIINNIFTIEEERVDVAKSTDRDEFYEQEGYTDVTLMPNYVPTIIAVQQLIYTQNYCGDEFTDRQNELFEQFIFVDALEQHKENYFFGTKYGSNWEFYHKPNLTQKSIPSKYRPLFWSYFREIFAQHPVAMLEAYQKQTSIIWSSIGYGPTPYRAYYKDEMLVCCSPQYLEFVTPIKEFLDDHIFYVYDGIFISLVRPASFLMGIFILCFIGYKRHKMKFIISMGPVYMNALAYMFVISSQDVRYFYINFLAFPIAIMYALLKGSGDEKEEKVK